MATLVVSGNRAFAQPGIDGGTFSVNPSGAVQIIARTFRVESGWVQMIASAGAAPVAPGTSPLVPAFSIYNTVTSAGLSLIASQLSAGQVYAWGTVGIGG